jgi:hypothetical protein
MVLDQAGSAIIGCDYTRERNLVAIKSLKGLDKSSMRGVRFFTSDYVVNIIETYFDNDDLVIIYKKMDISLRRITSILEGLLKPFQIAAICKEVSLPKTLLDRSCLLKAASSRTFLYTRRTFPMPRRA